MSSHDQTPPRFWRFYASVSPIQRFILFTGALFLMSVASGCSGSRIDVEVAGNAIESRGFPPLTLTVDPKFRYLGKDRFLLYGRADCEIHVFADLDGERVRRLLWVQFEGYLPSQIFSWYDYSDSPRRTPIGGYAYYDDVWPWDLGSRKRREGSDTDHVLDLVKEKGLTLGPDTMAIRLVRLDESSRNELMLIYIEDLADHGLKARALSGDDSQTGAWPGLSEGLRERALASFSVQEEGDGQ